MRREGDPNDRGRNDRRLCASDRRLRRGNRENRRVMLRSKMTTRAKFGRFRGETRFRTSEPRTIIRRSDALSSRLRTATVIVRGPGDNRREHVNERDQSVR